MENLQLFQSEPGFRELLAARLRTLAEEGIYLGTSSWKYPGWLGQIYTTERYNTRGRFSQKKFEEQCLAEYAETFPAVCGDFSFYQFPSQSYWQRLFSVAPPQLQFAFKVPEEITVREWPKHPRYGRRAGGENESYLDADLFVSAFLRPLERYASQVGVVIFEFGTMGKRHYAGASEFAGDLGRFLSRLPAGWRFAVEVRNKEYLDEPYFEALRNVNAAHVFSSWTRMPPLEEQVRLASAHTANFTVARALLRHGRTYEDAVATFQPYERVQEVNPGAREGLRELIEKSRPKKQTTFLFVNNRLEGNAPQTISAVVSS
ncbi:MAG: DUF72 domain-containing protein [Acidobacteria bacterium]|nr:DUF72 domain-containing protein [Acidobacteriota bacterium]